MSACRGRHGSEGYQTQEQFEAGTLLKNSIGSHSPLVPQRGTEESVRLRWDSEGAASVYAAKINTHLKQSSWAELDRKHPML